MAKGPVSESPADRVKRELAEREQREKEAEKAAAEQSTTSTLTEAELAALAKADEDEAVEKYAARELLLQSKASSDIEDQLAAARKRIEELENQKPEEDPEIVAERQRRFERAEAFEAEMARRRGKTTGSTMSALNPSPVDSADPSTTMQINVDKAAFDVIHRLALSLPLSTPPEHVLCGYGGIKITVGVVRALAGVKMG